MKNIIFRKNGKTYTQVQKAQFKKLFNENKVMYIIPNKANPFFMVELGHEIQKTELEKLIDYDGIEKFLNMFTFYNCNSELGYYLNYYLVEQE